MICCDWGVSINWTALSSIATAVMAIVTFITIYYNRKQIKEIQRQWNETNRARLAFSIVALNRFFYLKIENVGNETAYDVRISINASFLDKMLIQDFKNFLYNLCQKKLFLPPNKVMYYLLSPIYISSSLTIQHTSYSCQEINSNLDILINEPFVITGTYNGNRKITETLTINQCTGSVVVDSPKVQKLDDIYKELKNMNRKLQNIACKNKLES